MLFADDAALTANTKEALQQLISCFANTCREFGLTISLKKTNVMGQDVSSIPSISIGSHNLEVVGGLHLPWLNHLQQPIPRYRAKHTGQQGSNNNGPPAKRVWDNSMLAINTKMKVYQACVITMLLYGSEA